jgi:signal peptidase I
LSPGRAGLAGRARSLLVETALLVLVAAVIALLLRALVAQAFSIPSASMDPQLLVGDRVVVSKLAYRLHEPNRGDIVVFDCPPDAGCPDRGDDASLVTRGLRGLLEAVGLRTPSTEEYIKRVVGLPGETVEGRDGDVYIDGRRLVEPYLPAAAATSDFGPVEVGQRQLWVLGDNRANSSDSRAFGVIEEDTVVGRATHRVWPLTRTAFL